MSTSPDELTPERAVRLLRAKAGELEAQVLGEAETYGGVHRPVTLLAADIALIAGLLADFMERVDASLTLYEAHTENLIERTFALEEHTGIEGADGG